MPLSADAKNRLVVALTSNDAGAEVAAAIDGKVSTENSYIKTDVGVKDLLAASPVARIVMIVVTITTAFAAGDGAAPTLTIGEEGNATKFAAASKFTAAAAGTTFTLSGTLTATKKLQATIVAGTGTTETGAFTINVMTVG